MFYYARPFWGRYWLLHRLRTGANMNLSPVRRLQRRTVAIAGVLALAALSLVPAAASAATKASGAAATAPATTDTSPVNLSTKVNMADGKARQSATVAAGDARFEVLA